MQPAEDVPGSIQGAAAGFTILSPLSFQTLRRGGGQDTLRVRMTGVEPVDARPVLAWRARPGNPFTGRLMRAGSSFAYWANDAGWFAIHPADGVIELEPGPFSLRRELRLLGVPTTLCAMELGDMSLHAAAVEVDGVGIVLAGPSRAGKTTLAAAFAARGHRLLAEDSVRCGLAGRAVLHPGPAAVRLRADVAVEIAIPGGHADAGAGRSHDLGDPGRVPIVLHEAVRGDGGAVPLGAIFILRPSPEPIRLTAVTPPSAIRDLLALTFHLPDADARAAAFTAVTRLARQVPTFDLRRPLRLEAIEQTVDRIIRRVHGGA